MTLTVTPIAATALDSIPRSIAGTEMSSSMFDLFMGESIVGDIDELHEFAGRACYQSWSKPNPKTAENDGYIAHIIESQHESVLEHGSVTFYVEGISRDLTHQLIRHRHLSPSELSQRYVDMGTYHTVVPPLFAEDQEAINLIREVEDHAKAAYERLVEIGLAKDEAKRKHAREAARVVLPGGMETKIVITGNLRAWRYVIAKRYDEAADAEIQMLAEEILRQLKIIAPNSVQDFILRDEVAA